MGYHYIPKYYLKGFTPPNKPGVICRYEKGKQNVVCTSLENVAQETGFYSDETEAFLAESVEAPSNSVLAKIRDGRSIDSAEKVTLSQYMVVLVKRVPRAREKARVWFESNKGPYYAEVVSELDDLAVEHPEKTCFLQARKEEFRQIIFGGKIDPDSLWEQILPAHTTPMMLDAIPKMTWQFLVADGTDLFLTSDNPVFLSNQLVSATSSVS